MPRNTTSLLVGVIAVLVLLGSGCPSAGDPMNSQRISLDDVENWLYLIDVDLTEESVRQIEQSDHDMVVLDYIPSESQNTEYDMATTIERIQNSSTRKLVLAYIDIGEAEDYRTYWEDDWQVGDPTWITGEDPDGWKGNYPVAFWDSQWQDIWLSTNGLIEKIADAGFDGVYLDWVEAYSDENVLSAARSQSVDPRAEMIQFVTDIGSAGREHDESFIVIGQNALELVLDQDYVNAIDGVSQEQVWFDGGADGDPEGDCPLPRTEDEIDTEQYASRLSEPCLKTYRDHPESTLHTSSQEYLSQLKIASERGLEVFIADYALEGENISFVQEEARGLGYRPFVGPRSLDSFVEPYLAKAGGN